MLHSEPSYEEDTPESTGVITTKKYDNLVVGFAVDHNCFGSVISRQNVGVISKKDIAAVGQDGARKVMVGRPQDRPANDLKCPSPGPTVPKPPPPGFGGSAPARQPPVAPPKLGTE